MKARRKKQTSRERHKGKRANRAGWLPKTVAETQRMEDCIEEDRHFE